MVLRASYPAKSEPVLAQPNRSDSPNTLQAYLKGIYRELGTGKRNEAVESARASSLVD